MALQARYPDRDVTVSRDFGGLRVMMHGDTGMTLFSISDTGILAGVLGIGPDTDSPGGGGQPVAVA